MAQTPYTKEQEEQVVALIGTYFEHKAAFDDKVPAFLKLVYKDRKKLDSREGRQFVYSLILRSTAVSEEDRTFYSENEQKTSVERRSLPRWKRVTAILLAFFKVILEAAFPHEEVFDSDSDFDSDLDEDSASLSVVRSNSGSTTSKPNQAAASTTKQGKHAATTAKAKVTLSNTQATPEKIPPKKSVVWGQKVHNTARQLVESKCPPNSTFQMNNCDVDSVSNAEPDKIIYVIGCKTGKQVKVLGACFSAPKEFYFSVSGTIFLSGELNEVLHKYPSRWDFDVVTCKSSSNAQLIIHGKESDHISAFAFGLVDVGQSMFTSEAEPRVASTILTTPTRMSQTVADDFSTPQPDLERDSSIETNETTREDDADGAQTDAAGSVPPPKRPRVSRAEKLTNYPDAPATFMEPLLAGAQ